MPYSTPTEGSVDGFPSSIRSASNEGGPTPRVSDGTPDSPAQVAPGELAEWLGQRIDDVAERWSAAIRDQESPGTESEDQIVDAFTRHLVRFLPWMLGPYRDSVEPLWTRSAELFGSVAARRGLAAGEVIEEFQVLRELVIRDLYRDPPLGGRLPLSLREILRLNRGIDRGVTHASVGHTDALFFQFFEADGAVGATGEELLQEVLEQLGHIEEEMATVIGYARAAEFAG